MVLDPGEGAGAGWKPGLQSSLSVVGSQLVALSSSCIEVNLASNIYLHIKIDK